MPELEEIFSVFTQNILPIFAFFIIAYIVHRLSSPIAKRFQPLGDITMRNNPRRYERLQTLQALMSNMISIVAFIVAIILSLSRFVSPDSLLWVIGLFSAAFGLGARPFISDYLTGLSFMFENNFDVGDKIEIPMSPQRVEGVVEEVQMRITRIRGMDGELYTMPNGDIRVVRNFSRGSFSPANIILTIPAGDLNQVLKRLEAIQDDAMHLLPNLIEPWQIISKTGEMGAMVELTVIAKARFGKGAEMRPRLLALMQEHLKDVHIHAADTTETPRVDKDSKDVVGER